MKTTIELAEENENLKKHLEIINKKLRAFYDALDGIKHFKREIDSNDRDNIELIKIIAIKALLDYKK